MQAADYGFADVLTMTFPTAKALEQRRTEAHAAMVLLINRAKATGRLRQDFDPSDLVLIHMANLGVVNATGDAAPDAWRRVVALLIQSLQAPARGPLPASPEHEALSKAMLRASPAGITPREPDKYQLTTSCHSEEPVGQRLVGGAASSRSQVRVVTTRTYRRTRLPVSGYPLKKQT